MSQWLSVPHHQSEATADCLLARWDFLVKWILLAGELENAMALHSSALAWKIPWMEEPGGLQSMGSLRLRYD